MSHAIIVMENDEGKRKRAPIGYSWSALAFGFFLPLARGQWKEFGRSLGFTVATLGAYWLIQPFHANELYRSHLFKRGFRPVELEGVTISDLESRLGLPLQASVELGGRETRITSALEDGASSGEKAGFLKKYWWWLFVGAFAVLLIAFSSYEGNRLQELRSSDPAAYLAEIEGEPNYMEELKELDPEKYRATIKSQWDALYSAGRENAGDYVERLFRRTMVPEDKLVQELQNGSISGRQFQEQLYKNDLNARTIPFAKSRIEEGDYDVLLERGVVLKLSQICGDKPGYEEAEATLPGADQQGKWPLLDELDQKIQMSGLAPYASHVYLGTMIPFDREQLLRPYLPDPTDVTASCAKLRYVITRNRFYNKWNVDSPERDESDY